MVRFFGMLSFPVVCHPGAVHQNDAMRFTSNLAADCVKMHLHGFNVSKGQHQGRTLASFRAYGTGSLVALIGWLARACGLSCP